MEEAAKRLTAPDIQNKGAIHKVWFLSGKKHWYQTAFCAWTLQRHARFRIAPVIVDDGSFDGEARNNLSKTFPNFELWEKGECDLVFSQMFPAKNYPNLHNWRDRQILFRKLTDVYGRSKEWRLLLDSDILFFSRPKELEDLISETPGIFSQKDCWESYGYPRSFMESLAGAKLPEAINIGILNFSGKFIDWEKVEHWVGELEQHHGKAYNITQGTFAMILAGKEFNKMDGEKYKVYPHNPKSNEPLPVCGHYVADSKPWYFGQGWKKALELAGV